MRLAKAVSITGKNILLALSGLLAPRIFGNIDFFGFWMASLGAVNGDAPPVLLVGAPGRDIEGKRLQGQAFLFRGADGALVQTLNAPTPQDMAAFGYALALAGDVDGDGIPDLLVGAPGRHVEGKQFQGQAFLFRGADGALLHTLNDPTPQAFAQFGRPVYGIGDLNGDGVPRVAVGAPWQDVEDCRHQGQLFIFNGTDGTLLHTLNNPNPQPGAYFGRRMATLGDLNGDGVPEIAVGATGQDVDGCSSQGQVFIFNGVEGTLLRTLDDPIPQAGARFGRVIASIGDLNADGVPEIAVGAPRQSMKHQDQGLVFIFNGADGALLRTLNSPVPQTRARFGDEVTSVGDLNGDGVPEIAVGANGQHVNGCPHQGQVFIFSGADGTLLRTLNDPTPQAGARFGCVIVSISDLNGDGVSEIAVGAPHQDVDGCDQGQVFIFSGVDGAPLLTLNAPPTKRAPAFIKRAISTRSGALR